jgi:di/tricarboxylate transporter
MLLSAVINNAATVVLMAPIGIGLAQGIGASIDPFLMAIAVGASSSFLTPIAHQSNVLVMGPGGYRFADYLRLGAPLSLLVMGSSVPLILLFWPL